MDNSEISLELQERGWKRKSVGVIVISVRGNDIESVLGAGR